VHCFGGGGGTGGGGEKHEWRNTDEGGTGGLVEHGSDGVGGIRRPINVVAVSGHVFQHSTAGQ